MTTPAASEFDRDCFTVADGDRYEPTPLIPERVEIAELPIRAAMWLAECCPVAVVL